MLTKQGRKLSTLYSGLDEDIYKFCSAFKFEPTFQQRQILDAVQRAVNNQGPRRIGAKSGQGTGKTTAAAITALWRCIRNVDALTILTAPTMEQCKENFLKECRRLHDMADPILQKLFDVTKTRVIFGGRPDWGVKLKASTKPENAQGKHDEFLTVIMDEWSGISREIVEQYEGTLTNKDALLLGMGNPNSRDCAMFDCFTRFRDKWFCVTLNAEESPIVSQENVRYIGEKYGFNSDVYRVRVLGEFPLMDPNCIMSIEDLEACTKNDRLKCALVATKRGGIWVVAKQFGLDFARYGDDENVTYRRSGLALVEEAIYRKTDPSVLVAKAFAMQKAAMWTDADTHYVPDATGIGQGTMHLFYAAKKPNIFEYYANGRAQDSRQYENRATEAWFGMASNAKARVLYLPNDHVLLQQLTSRQYYLTKDGKIEVESKDEYKKRGFESPDRADAAVQSFYDMSVGESQSAGRAAASTLRQMGGIGLVR